MFDIGWGELLVIGIVALVAIGPKELPTVMRSLGHWMGKIKRMASEFQGQFQEALREADVADLKKQADEMASAITDATHIDPLADSEIKSEPVTEPETAASSAPAETAPSASTETANTDAPATATEPLQIATPEPEAPPAIEMPPPEPPVSVTEKDFTAVEPPPPQQAGGKA
jgi:sec-independent protein translocase protein TatB